MNYYEKKFEKKTFLNSTMQYIYPEEGVISGFFLIEEHCL